MKNRLKKNNNFAIYNFPYYKKNRGFLRMFVAKALLAFITCFCGAYYFTQMLDMGGKALPCALTAGTSCLVFTLFFGMFGRRYVLSAAMILALIFRKPLTQWGKDFAYHVIKIADGKLIDADRILGYIEKTADGGGIDDNFINGIDPLPFLLVLSAVFGLIFALCSHHRFKPELILTFFAVMLIPSFLSLHTSYKPALGVFFAGTAAMWCSSMSYSANCFLAAGGAANVSFMDSQYRKSVRGTPPVDRIKSGSIHFNKFFSDSAVIFISMLLTVSVTAACFPIDGNLKLDGVIEKLSQSVKNVGEWGSGIIGSFNSTPYKGFFSADGGSINISNGINPNETSQSNTPVLEVITQNKDKLYLRGDIGYSFDGKNWKSISDIDYSGISYNPGIGVGYIPLNDVLGSYVPEIEMYFADKMLENYRNSVSYDMELYSENPFMSTQSVKINYLRKMNTVLFPGTPLIYSFRENENYSVKGDFIALADKGRINSMETFVLYSNIETDLAYVPVFGQTYDSLTYGAEEFDDLPVTEDEYKIYKEAYKKFVYDYYTEIPDEEMPTVLKFEEQLRGDRDFSFFDFRAFMQRSGEDMQLRAMLAQNMEDYFTEGGQYKYSLNSDNFSGEETPLYSFLFDTKSGHCAMYASAMCLMLRHCGVPARYVTGFAVGGEKCEEVSGGYKYTVLQKNLHSWVEVYYDNVGWLPYDPTPGGGMSAYTPSGSSEAESTTAISTTPAEETTSRTTAATSASAAESETDETTALSDSSSDYDDPFSGGENGGNLIAARFFKALLLIAGIPAAVFLIILICRTALGFVNKKQSQKMKFFRNGDAKKAISEMLEFSVKLLGLNGIRRQKGETPEEFGFRADKTLKSGNVFREAVPFYERAEFDSDPEFTAEEQLLVYGSTLKLLKLTLDRMGGIKRFIARVKLFVICK